MPTARFFLHIYGMYMPCDKFYVFYVFFIKTMLMFVDGNGTQAMCMACFCRRVSSRQLYHNT